MKLLFSILLTLTLISCKSTNNLPTYSYVVNKDTITIVTEEITYNNIYQESLTFKTVVIDTVILKWN